jgi:hypothetical protein
MRGSIYRLLSLVGARFRPIDTSYVPDNAVREPSRSFHTRRSFRDTDSHDLRAGV